MSSLCATCSEPLVVVLSPSDDDDEDENEQMTGATAGSGSTRTVPDDCAMRCGCHFHWQCLLDSYNVTSCPVCSSELTSVDTDGEAQILCTLRNEGGLQEDIDILPVLTEEQYLRAFPNERRARAFLQFCREGNLEAVVHVLKTADDDDDDTDDDGGEGAGGANPVDVLRYQDPMGDKFSALHSAVAGGSQEVAWLLLLLASELDLTEFPPLVFQEAEVLGLMREDTAGKVDVRGLRDAQGRSAEDIAAGMGNPWRDWIGKKRLTL